MHAAENLLCLTVEKQDPISQQVISSVISKGYVSEILQTLNQWENETGQEIPTLFSGLKKYLPEVSPTMDEIYEALTERAKLPSILIGLFIPISSFPFSAHEVLPAVPFLEKLLNRATKKKDLNKKDQLLQAQAQYYTCKVLNDVIQQFCPGIIGSILLVFKNLSKNINGFKIKMDIEPICFEEAVRSKSQGNTEFAQKDFDLAIEFYTLAIQLAPSHPEAHLFYSNRSECYLQMKMHNDAYQDALKALQLCPGHEKSLNRMKRASTAKMDEPD